MSDRGFNNTQPSKAAVVSTICSKAILCSLPIAQIAVGASYQNDCPKQHYIPIYLEVMGVLQLLMLGLSFLPCCKQFSTTSMAFSGMSFLLLFCWFITGNVWIYSIYEPHYNKTMTNVDPALDYCNKTLYQFAFWTTNLTYIQMGLLVCFCCCCPRYLHY